MSYLFLVHIGPVQDFIASARRSRDLAFGSWFLSEISRAAASAMREQQGKLIFPYPEQADSPTPHNGELSVAQKQKDPLEPYNGKFSVANRIVALIPQPLQNYGTDGLGQLVYDAIMRRLDDIKERAYFGIELPSSFLKATAERQIKDLVEFFWVALPYDEQDIEKYAPTRQNLEALMAARKNTRDFAQAKGEALQKSSIDGRLESVIPEDEFPSNRDTEEKRLKKIRDLYNKYGAGPAERLSGVDLLKRHGLKTWHVNFPGTGHIAALPFLQRLRLLDEQAQGKAQKKWHAYIEKVKEIGKPRYDESAEPVGSLVVEREYELGEASTHPVLQHYDGTMLFEERLVELVEGKIDQANQEKIQQAKTALQQFYKYIDAQFSQPGSAQIRPNPYYALLQADGDGMGNAIDAQAKYGPEGHQELSRQLSRFAGEVRRIVKDNRGWLVYSGGDDVLAFLPLDTVLSCAKQLHDEFGTYLQKFQSDDNHPPTLSVGIVIAHFLDSLKHVRDLAFEAEKRAKDFKGKDALAITISKRGGEDYQLVGSWGIVDEHLKQIVEYYHMDTLPAGTPYELRDMLLRLTAMVRSDPSDADKKLIKTLPQVIRQDALRIVTRKLSVPRDKFSKREGEKIESSFKMRLTIQDEEKKGNEQETASLTPEEEFKRALKRYQACIKDITEFINELIIGQVIADAEQMAAPDKRRKRS